MNPLARQKRVVVARLMQLKPSDETLKQGRNRDIGVLDSPAKL